MPRLAYLLSIFLGGFLLSLITPTSPAADLPAQTDTPSQHNARMKWWRDARFGMFIHWGLYAVPAGEYHGKKYPQIGEWIMAFADIPRQEYEKFARQFNPTKYNPEQWVRLAKQAGMRYIVITSKHHDGFCLFNTTTTDYNVVKATPYGKDILKLLSEACKREGIKFCVYYSILDWHHPAQYADPEARRRGDASHGRGKNRMHPERKAEYIRYMKTQLKELITQYDPAVLWFDGEWQDWWTEADGKDLYSYVRSLKPDIIVNNRVGKGRKGMEGLNKGAGYAGDFGTPEQQIPSTGLPGVDWESCMTMNDTWGYKSFDHHWKSTKSLVRNLIDVASKGGNYLRNVGPMPNGEIPSAIVERLHGIGRWMKTNGEAIHGTKASPYPAPSWGRYTRGKDRLYALVFDGPKDGRLSIPASGNEIAQAYLLADPTHRLKMDRFDHQWSIHLPARAPDPIATVVVVKLGAQ